MTAIHAAPTLADIGPNGLPQIWNPHLHCTADPHTLARPHEERPVPSCTGSRHQTHQVSWRRILQVLLNEHAYLGPRLYWGMAHALVGMAVWAAGAYTDSLSLMSYGFIVIHDGCNVLADLIPLVLEYSANNRPTTKYGFGLTLLDTLAAFTNCIVLMYRGLQSLMEGVEHMAVNVHAHEGTATIREFETYSHSTDGHNGRKGLAATVVAAGLCITCVSALKAGANSRLWALRTGSASNASASPSGAQNLLLNPCNVASVVGGLWCLAKIALAASDEHSVDPFVCVVLACVIWFICLPNCVKLAKVLLFASSDQAMVDRIVWTVMRIEGVVECRPAVWNSGFGRRSGVLRVKARALQDVEGVRERAWAVCVAWPDVEWTVEVRS